MQNALNCSLIPKFICLLLFCTFSSIVLSANRTSSQNGNWNLISTWGNQSVPVAGDIVTINHIVTITATAACANVTINATKQLILNNFVFTVTGVWTNNGTFTPTGTVTFGAGTPSIAAGSGLENFNKVSVASGSALTINTGADVMVGGTFAFLAASTNNSVTLNGTASLTVAGAFSMPRPSSINRSSTLAIGLGTFTANGSFTMSGTAANRSSIVTIGTSGTANFSAITTTATAGSIITVTGSGTINISGAISANPPNLTPASGTVNYIGSTAQNIWVRTYYNLGISATATKTCTGTLTVTNGLNVDNGSVLGLSGTGTPLGFTGVISGTGIVLYSRTTAQTVSAATFPNLEFTAAGTKTIPAGATVTVIGNWIVGSTTTMTTTAKAVVGGNISGSGNITMGSGTINIAGNWTNNGTFAGGTGTVIYDGAAQDIAGLTYYKLQTSNNGIKTLLANTTVNNILTIDASTTIDLSSFTLNLTGAGTPLVNNNGTFTSSTSTVNFSNAASTNIPALKYYNLNGTGGPRAFASTGTIGIANTFTPGAGTYNVSTSTVNFNGSIAQTIPTFTFYKLILSNSNNKTIPNGTIVNVNNLEVQDNAVLNILGNGLINITN